MESETLRPLITGGIIGGISGVLIPLLFRSGKLKNLLNQKDSRIRRGFIGGLLGAVASSFIYHLTPLKEMELGTVILILLPIGIAAGFLAKLVLDRLGNAKQ